MGKNRTISNAEVAFENPDEFATEKGEHYSEFMITFNPNKSFYSPKSPGFKETEKKLIYLGDWILKKKNIKRILKFGKPNDQENPLNRDRNYHLNLIKEIDDDRFARVEWAKKTKQLHIHIYFTVKHFTYIQVDRALFRKIASKIMGIPSCGVDQYGNLKYPFHCNFKGAGKMGYYNYVKKYDDVAVRDGEKDD